MGAIHSGGMSQFVAGYFGAWAVRGWSGFRGDCQGGDPMGPGDRGSHRRGLLSCVLAARRPGGGPAVLKITGPWTAASHEALALEHWDGGPTPRLLDFDEGLSALLLERIWPGERPQLGPGTRWRGWSARCTRHSRQLTDCRAAALAPVVEERFVTAGQRRWRARRRSPPNCSQNPAAEAGGGSAAGRFRRAGVLVHGDLEYRNILRCERAAWRLSTRRRASATLLTTPPTDTAESNRCRP